MRTTTLVLALLASPCPAQDCSGISVGFVPLNDLGQETHLGAQGGLYPGGVNHAPPAHDQLGLALAQGIVPRGPSGVPSAEGVIVLLSIGLSNTTQEWSQFKQDVQGDPSLNQKLVIVDGAQGGVPASEAANPGAPYWTTVDQRLQQAGVTPAQVQAVWMKTAEKAPSAPFPADAQELQGHMRSMVQIVKDEYPNTRVLFLSSRIYAGYAVTGLNPEPFAYQSGFAVKWLIEDQIQGDADLNPDAAVGAVEAPWLAWGPYLWADGLDPRSDTLAWECGDFAADGTHPGPAARAKVSDMLQRFFATHAAAKTWYLAQPAALCSAQARTEFYGSGVPGAGGVPQITSSILATVPSAEPFRLHVRGVLPDAPGAFVVGFQSFPPGAVPLFGGSLLTEPVYVFPGAASDTGKQWADLGAIPSLASWCGDQVFAQYGAIDPSAPQGVSLSRGLRVVVGH